MSKMEPLWAHDAYVNARTHNDQQVAQIAASICEFGFTNPVLIDEEDGIIAGAGRVLAAHLLGLDEVPCIVLAHLTPTQRRAYVLALPPLKHYEPPRATTARRRRSGR
jgi:ParB-like chromosome segregation protein Spo0J